MDNTDLDQVKSIAKLLLREPIHETELSPMIVQHPFASSGFVVPPGMNEMIDITANVENLTKWQDCMDKAIVNAKSVYAIYVMINKPYALTFLKYVKDSLSANETATILADAWIRSECPHMDVDVSIAELVAMFTQADKKHLMIDEEREMLSRLGEIVTVYRGVTSYNAKKVKALSWTIDKKKAEWFAHRFNGKGTVYAARIKKSDIYAVFIRRNESEIVVNPNGLLQLKKVEG